MLLAAASCSVATCPPLVAEPLVFQLTSLSLPGPLLTTLPNWSCNCTVTVIGASTVPSVGFKITNFAAASCVTVNDNPLPPVPLVERLPSLAVNVTGPSALYPTSVPPAELTPLVKLIVVTVPRVTAEAVLSVTVGTCPSGAVPSPPKVKVLSPVKVVTVLPN